LRLIPKPHRTSTKDVFNRSGRSISGWINGTLVSMAITATLVLVCLLALGVPAPIALALLAGLSQIVPVIGPVASAGIGIILAASVSFEVAAGVALAYFVISQLEANVITPNILKQAVKVPPATVLFSILAMGTLFGSLGVVLAIPAFLVLNDGIEVLLKPVNSKKNP
jgi:predicted PurR-regulated permease PerM